MKACVITLGCKVNAYESEYIKEEFKKISYEITDDESEADIIVINTCTVTNQSDVKSRKLIRHARKMNKSAIIVVCGCSAEHHKEKLMDLDIDILIGNKDKSRIASLVERYREDHDRVVKFYDLRSTPFEDMKIDNFADKTRGFVKIQDGCNNFCAYCIIPFMRGNIRSKDLDVAISEVKCLADNGYQEIVLTGIHTGSYGRDKDYDLVDLIRQISKIEKIKRIRISSIEITELNDKFLAELKDNGKICDHLHIPLQSGDDAILKRMGRKYTIAEFKSIVNRIRAIRPEINITTDLIVGFPGEKEENFLNTLANLRDIGFSKIHTFPYSERSGTRASTMDDKVDPKLKKERVHKVLKLSEELENSYYKKFIDKDLDVLVEDGNIGLTSNYIKVNLNNDIPSNSFVTCKIVAVDNLQVTGIIDCNK